MPKALFISANYWTTPFQVGTHHIAKGLAKKGWDIAFISEPVSPLHKLKYKDTHIQKRFRIHKDNGGEDLKGKITYYVPFTFLPYYNLFPFNIRYNIFNWYKFTFPSIIKFLDHIDFKKVDLLYFDTIRQPFWLKVINYGTSVFRIPDFIGGYSSYSNALRISEEYLIKNVDKVLYTAKSLEDHIKNYRSENIHYLPNGVDVELFSNSQDYLPEELNNIPAPRIIYIGETEKRFDHDLLIEVAKKCSNISFIIIGDIPERLKDYSTIDNVYFLGKRSYNSLPAYLKNCNAGIIPYDVSNKKKLIDHINPLKMYQYFAAGLPVLAPEWKELKLLNPPVSIYRDTNDLVQLLNKLNLNDIKSDVYKEYASQFDWGKIIDKFIEIIN